MAVLNLSHRYNDHTFKNNALKKEGRRRRERNIDKRKNPSAASCMPPACALTQNPTGNLSVNGTSLNQLIHTSQDMITPI